MDVHVCPAFLNSLPQVFQRFAAHDRANQVGSGRRADSERSLAAPGDELGWRPGWVQPQGVRPGQPWRSCYVDVGHGDVLNVGHDQPIAEGLPICAELEDRLALAIEEYEYASTCQAPFQQKFVPVIRWRGFCVLRLLISTPVERRLDFLNPIFCWPGRAFAGLAIRLCCIPEPSESRVWRSG